MTISKEINCAEHEYINVAPPPIIDLPAPLILASNFFVVQIIVKSRAGTVLIYNLFKKRIGINEY